MNDQNPPSPNTTSPRPAARLAALGAALLLLSLAPGAAAQAPRDAAIGDGLALIRQSVADAVAAGVLPASVAVSAETLLAGDPTHAEVEEFHRVLLDAATDQVALFAASPESIPDTPESSVALGRWLEDQRLAGLEVTAGPCEQACNAWYEACVKACTTWWIGCMRAIGWWPKGAAWCTAIYLVCLAVCYVAYKKCLNDCKTDTDRIEVADPVRRAPLPAVAHACVCADSLDRLQAITPARHP